MKKLEDVSRGVNFAEEEEKVLKYWKKIDAFKTSLKKSEGKKPFSFYDGPPFATGLPHYGHLLAGTIKDIVTRYAHQTGHYVERRFGWDCHGLPIEFAIEKEIGIKTKEDVMNFGIRNYNNECRKIVTRYCKEWEVIVGRLGRWIDFQNDYKTMDLSFMESVWWVFSQLFKKNLVYKGFKVMPYSTACTTPLSNFEVQQNYKEVYDPSIVITFPLVEDENTKLIAWTTTPWTLPSNLACCVNSEMDYVAVKPKDKPEETWILAKCRLDFLFPKKSKKKGKGKLAYEILREFKGADLVGKQYTPLFTYFKGKFDDDKVFHVVSDDYVTDESGTGVVHQAPAFGEDDFRICMKNGIVKKGGEIACPVDDNGRFVAPVEDFKGLHVKAADDKICEYLKKAGRLVRKESVKHSYPFCWRSDTPLIYKAVPSWFVRVEEVKENLLKNNSETYWVPNFVKEKRFHNWLENARDWAISRTRYWGCPIPIWISEDGEEIVCVSSVEELEKLSGKPKGSITDIHRENIDDITIPSQKGKGPLRRISDVFDCWFESGSMPYAQAHYPFENKKKFEDSFPADFIAEGLDQTRGWFYTLMVLGTCLFNKPPFKNLIVNGLVLAADGKKMSKSLKNFPDPMLVVNKYGADALRLYLINSPVVRAEPLKFEESGVQKILQNLFLPWYNAYRFFIQNMKRYVRANDGKGFGHREACDMKPDNLMDQWVISCSQTLVKLCKEEMAAYRLYTVVPQLVKFVEQLTNWYVRLNRPRLKGDNGNEEWKKSLVALYRVLRVSVLSLSPFCPFLAEKMYQNLKFFEVEEEEEETEGESAAPEKKESKVEASVHFLPFPEFNEKLVFPEIESAVQKMQSVVVAVRRARDKKSFAVKQPLQEVKILSLKENELEGLDKVTEYMKLEMNVKEITFGTNVTDYFKFTAVTNDRVLGKRLRRKLGEVKKTLRNITNDDVLKFLESGTITVCGEKLTGDDCRFESEFIGDGNKYEFEKVNSYTMVLLDTELTKDLELEGCTRNLLSSIQQCRKKANLVVEDKVDVLIRFLDEKVQEKEVVDTPKYRDMLVDMMKPYMTLRVIPLNLKFDNAGVFYTQNVPDVDELEVKFNKKRSDRLVKFEKEIPVLKSELEKLENPDLYPQASKNEKNKRHKGGKKKKSDPNQKKKLLEKKKNDLKKKLNLALENFQKAKDSKLEKPEIKYTIYLVRQLEN